MVLSMKKMLALVAVGAALVATQATPAEALRTRRRMSPTGINHVTKYKPHVVEETDPNAGKGDAEAGMETDAENDTSFDVADSDDVSVDMASDDSVELVSSEDVDVDVDGANPNVDVDVGPKDQVDYSASGSNDIDIEYAGSLNVDASMSLDKDGKMEAEVDFMDGEVDLDLDEDEDYDQTLEYDPDEMVEEEFIVPTGASKIRLRMYQGNVDLDIVKGAPTKKQPAEKTEEKPTDVSKDKPTDVSKDKPAEKGADTTKTENAVANEEESVSYAAQATEWLEDNGTKPAFLGGVIGAAVGIVGVAGVAIAKSRKRQSARSMLAADVDSEEVEIVSEDAEAESDSDSDEESDEELKGADALTEEDEAADKKTSVVEGSV